MLKKEARKEFKKRRETINPADQNRWDDLILIQFQSLELPYVDYLLSYYPIDANREINSFLLADYLHFKNPAMHICYPKMQEEAGRMHAIISNADSAFESNSSGILEPFDNDAAAPELIDLVLIPLLAFDHRGYRVGYGKGYYDRYLKDCREDCLKVGLSYFEPLDAIEDAAEFDVPLDICITPQRAYVF